MTRLDLSKLSIPDAKLVQLGLNELGYYHGTYAGKPGPKTQAAYDRYREEQDGTAPAAGATTQAKSLPALLVEILLAEEGVREVPKDSNTGERVQEYQEATWLAGTRWPWCAAFLCWGLLEAERRLGGRGSLGFARPQTAGAWDFENWAKKQGLRLMKPRGQVRAGDIVCFTFSHIGLAIEDENGGTVTTVEGNTNSGGSREGGGVYVQKRALSLIRSNICLKKA